MEKWRLDSYTLYIPSPELWQEKKASWCHRTPLPIVMKGPRNATDSLPRARRQVALILPVPATAKRKFWNSAITLWNLAKYGRP